MIHCKMLQSLKTKREIIYQSNRFYTVIWFNKNLGNTSFCIVLMLLVSCYCRRSQGGSPNRNASNDKFARKTASVASDSPLG